jgi:transposase
MSLSCPPEPALFFDRSALVAQRLPIPRPPSGFNVLPSELSIEILDDLPAPTTGASKVRTTAQGFGRSLLALPFPGAGYDQLAERRFEFIPLWGFLVFLLYTMRRVDCRRCGVVAVEEVPWGEGQIGPLGAAAVMERDGGGLSYILGQGVRRGRICCHLIGKERTIESFQGFFTTMGEEITSKIVFICSDMWEPYLKVIRERCSEALHILDRFHIVKTVRAYLLKEAFQQLWNYSSPAWAGKFLDEWCHQTRRSRIEPMKKIARPLRQHRELILSYFRAQKLISSWVVKA